MAEFMDEDYELDTSLEVLSQFLLQQRFLLMVNGRVVKWHHHLRFGPNCKPARLSGGDVVFLLATRGEFMREHGLGVYILNSIYLLGQAD